MRYTNQISVSWVSLIPEGALYQGVKAKQTGLQVAAIDKMPVCYFGKNNILKDDGEYDFYMAPLTIPKGFSFRLYDSASDSIVENSALPLEHNFQLHFIFDIEKTSDAEASGNRSINSSQPAHDDCEAEHFKAYKIAMPETGAGGANLSNGTMPIIGGVGKGCVGSLALNLNIQAAAFTSDTQPLTQTSRLVFFYEYKYSDYAAAAVKGKSFYFIPILFPNFVIGYLRIPKNNQALSELKKVADARTMHNGIKAFDLEVNEKVSFEEILVGTMYVTKAIKAIIPNRPDIVVSAATRVSR